MIVAINFFYKSIQSIIKIVSSQDTSNLVTQYCEIAYTLQSIVFCD